MMCKKHNPRKIDECLKNLIFRLKQYGIQTVGCCCGHGKYPMTIIVKDKIGIYDMVSDETIPRTRRFYFKDAEGYYYVPETVKIIEYVERSPDHPYIREIIRENERSRKMADKLYDNFRKAL